MAKKSFMTKFREFVDSMPAESNTPMTGKEIARTKSKKKAKAKRATASMKASKAKKAAPKKATKKKTKKSKRGR